MQAAIAVGAATPENVKCDCENFTVASGPAPRTAVVSGSLCGAEGLLRQLMRRGPRVPIGRSRAFYLERSDDPLPMPTESWRSADVLSRQAVQYGRRDRIRG